MSIQDMLFELQDKEYRDFQSNLIPNIPREKIIGVRIPIMRKFAKKIIKEKNTKKFLNDLPHHYYDENILQSILISEISDYDDCVGEINHFLPHIDNWAVCDILSPKVFKKNKNRLIIDIDKWLSSKHLYTCRFGLKMLMTHYLDEDFLPEYLEIASLIRSEKYYLQMMIAWYFATALAKQWEETIPYLKDGRLDTFVHNKTIQKARESRRITDERKEYLKSLKR